MRLRSDDLFTTVVDGQTVLLDGRSSQYLTTNGAGSVMLEVLAADASESDLVRALQDRYAIGPDVAERDCRTFLAQLREHDFLDE